MSLEPSTATVLILLLVAVNFASYTASLPSTTIFILIGLANTLSNVVVSKSPSITFTSTFSEPLNVMFTLPLYGLPLISVKYPSTVILTAPSKGFP